MTAVLLLGCLFFCLGPSCLSANYCQILIRFSLSFVQKRFLRNFFYTGIHIPSRPVVPTKHGLLLYNFVNSNFKLSRGYLDPALNNPAQGATESKKIIIK